jgi:hypothetical protein
MQPSNQPRKRQHSEQYPSQLTSIKEAEAQLSTTSILEQPVKDLVNQKYVEGVRPEECLTCFKFTLFTVLVIPQAAHLTVLC